MSGSKLKRIFREVKGIFYSAIRTRNAVGIFLKVRIDSEKGFIYLKEKDFIERVF